MMQPTDGMPIAESMAQALEEYLLAAEEGTAPPRDEFLARYPELADELDACLAALDFIGRAAEAPRAVAAGLADAQAPPEASGQLGDFRLIREVGRGGMGVVYEAEQVSLGRRVALKVLPFAATMDPRQLQRFHNEARAAAALDHPHIVHVHAVGHERAVHFYAMQFIEGQTLATVIADLRRPGGAAVEPTTTHLAAPAGADTAARAAAATERAPRDRASFRRAAELGIQAAEALDYAHALGIVHRDVKPANLLVDGRGNLWITDFGLAHVQSDVRLTMSGDLVGTLRYMSPEQALAKRVVVDHRTDVYSLGATLYELLTLEPAFAGNDRQELLRQIAFEEPRPARRINRSIPAELETIVQKAMEKNPADRYATAKELADDLRQFLDDRPIRARRIGTVRRLRKWGRRHPAVIAAAAAAMTMAVAVLSGSVGWVANDRATRAEWTADAIRTALADSAQWQERRQVPDALAAAQRAKAALAGGHADPALRRQVESRVNDLELLDRLENIRRDGNSAPDELDMFSYQTADDRYRAAFREAALEVETLPAPQAGAQIGATMVAVELAAALDDWAALRLALSDWTDPGWKHLLHVACVADPDPWRVRLRQELQRRDRAGILDLASSEDVFRLMPATLLWLVQAVQEREPQRGLALLREMQRRNPSDFWANIHLAAALRSAKPADLNGAIRFNTAAVAIRPQSHAAHCNLANALADAGRRHESVAEYREAIAIHGKWVEARARLANTFRLQGKLDEAIAECHAAIAINKDDHAGHAVLGMVLRDKGDVDGAIRELRIAVELNKNSAETHFSLGLSLRDRGDVDGAVRAYREAIRCKPAFASAHMNLGNILRNLGELDQAIEEHQAAVQHQPDNAQAHNNLGIALYDKGDLPAAAAAFRKALQLNGDYALALNNLSNVLNDSGDVDGALAAGHKAVSLMPGNAELLFNLGMHLRDNGRFAEALTYLRRGHDAAAKQKTRSYPSARWITECERYIELEPRLADVLGGKRAPVGAAESAEYAKLCVTRRLYASATRLYREALRSKPTLGSLANGLRYDAACTAARAGCGHGKDAADVTDVDRAGFRALALDWLRADREAWARLLQQQPAKLRTAVAKKMQHWLYDVDLNGVRNPDAVAHLPEAERRAWQELWQEVRSLRQDAGTSPRER
jgi:serine/threonine protein kinase/tetratricopeptide (TPR) repeat protein